MARRFLGGIFGNTVPAASNVPSIGGVYDLNGQYYMKQEGAWESVDNMAASGGTTTTYTDPTGQAWKSHTFTSSGSFVVTTAPGASALDADFLVQGAGGGSKAEGDSNRNAGSGAGGLLYGPAGTMPVATYSITIGAGGSGGNGSNTVLGGAPGAAIGASGQTATGGGAGGVNDSPPNCLGADGGCGGGGWWSNPGAGGEGTQPNPGLAGITKGSGDGSPGSPSPEYGGAGGGTGGPAPGQGTNKGPGTANVYRYGPTNSQTYGAGGESSDYSTTPRNANGASNSGDGAGGHGTGGSGIIVIRYKVTS